jgi:hypothetical protein
LDPKEKQHQRKPWIYLQVMNSQCLAAKTERIIPTAPKTPAKHLGCREFIKKQQRPNKTKIRQQAHRPDQALNFSKNLLHEIRTDVRPMLSLWRHL